MTLSALKLQDQSMFGAARGRLASIQWRVGQGVVFATGASFALDSFLLGFGWLAALCAAMAVDYVLGKRYLEAKTDGEREFVGLLFILACAATITVFAAMTIGVAFAGGAPGKVLSVLMSASSLVSVMIFLFQAPVFMAITAVPCTICLAVVPFTPFHASPADPLQGAIGVGCGIAAFLAYVARAAVNNGKMFVGLQEANRIATERRADAESKRAEAEAANQAKTEFLTTMTHELRTPLNAVIGYSEIINEDMAQEGRTELADDANRITAAARHLLGLIDQILQLSKMEAGKSDLETSDVDVRKLVDLAVAGIAEQAKAGKNRIASRIASDVGLAHTDGPKLALCINHLLSNAAKFTQNGLVALSVDRETTEGREWLRVAVSDTGIGMTQEQIATAFEPFKQVDGSATRSQGGMGLGLTITAQTAQLLGGEVAAVSEPGAGSTFTLRVPMRLGISDVSSGFARSDAARGAVAA
jgi:signal transduction histidine kinase